MRVGVRATSNLRWLQNKPLETVVVDLSNPAACADFLAGTTHLVHCAGVVVAPDDESYQRGNVQPTVNLLAGAEQAWSNDPNHTFILISSLAAHGPASLSAPALEDNPCHPITAYGRSKRDAEKAVLAADPAFRRAILRPPSLYGPRDSEFLPLLKAATNGWTAKLGQQMTGLSLVDGRDCAAATLALLDTPTATGIYFVADTEVGYDWDQMQAALGKMANRTVRRITVPMSILRLVSGLTALFGGESALLLNPDRLRDLDSVGWVCDGSRLTRDTGFKASRTAATGFTETLDFYRKNGWL